MSKSQNTKDEQQKDLCITSEQLTEKWKKGELELGKHYYYTTIFSPTVHIQNFTRDVISFQDFKETIAEVLAPVPSFGEWQAKLEENTKLKELVKELRKTLQKETPALRVENAKLKTQVFLLKGLLDKWLPEFDYYHDTLTSQFCREARKLLGEE